MGIWPQLPAMNVRNVRPRVECVLPSALVMVTLPLYFGANRFFTPDTKYASQLMFFFNSPGKNIFVNFGLGIWNTYNNVSGLVGDLLSYIRLFAIGLSGGILAMVFNQLAVGMSPDIPVVKQLVMLLILLLGHSINLFMCVLSSVVHPLRLTFVEFYKNAGFEAATRVFTPLKNE